MAEPTGPTPDSEPALREPKGLSTQDSGSISQRLADRLSPAHYIPVLAPGTLEVRRFARSGEAAGRPPQAGPPDRSHIVVKHVPRKAYVRLAPEDEFVFRRIDGRRSVQELVLVYFREYRVFAFERVAGLVQQLRAAGFLADPPADAY